MRDVDRGNEIKLLRQFRHRAAVFAGHDLEPNLLIGRYRQIGRQYQLLLGFRLQVALEQLLAGGIQHLGFERRRRGLAVQVHHANAILIPRPGLHCLGAGDQNADLLIVDLLDNFVFPVRLLSRQIAPLRLHLLDLPLEIGFSELVF